MLRKTAWRKTVSDVVNWHQDQALRTTMFILKEYGPTGFLLKEDEDPKNYKVCLGDPHSCTCVTFQKEKEICKHICWILMRKFRLPKDHEYCFQLGLVERQILEVLHGLYRTRTPHPPDSTTRAPERPGSGPEDGAVGQKAIGEDDVCPICQEELLKKKLPVTHCRFGCGNNVHICCMKVWADHQSRSEADAMVKCPLCRKDFGTFMLLLQEVKAATQMCTSLERARLDRHLGVPCSSCRVCPIVGKCFKCTVCHFYHLCEDCLKSRCHPQHSFAVRTKRNQPWQPLGPSVDDLCSTKQIKHTQALHPNITSDVIPEHVLNSLPVVRVCRRSRLLEVGMQCRLCLQGFRLGQLVKTLPCRHKFHAGCLETWLHQSICCPLDWQNIYNPLEWNGDGKVTSTVTPANNTQTWVANQQRAGLFIPGTGLRDRTARARASAQQNAEQSDLPGEGQLAPLSFEMLIQGTQCLRINGTRSGRNSSDLLGLMTDHSRDPTSTQRRRSLGPAPGSNSRRRLGGKTMLTSPCMLGRTEGPVGIQHSLFLGLPEHAEKAQPRTSILPGKIGPLRQRDRALIQSSRDVSDLGPWTTNIPISAKRQRYQEKNYTES